MGPRDDVSGTGFTSGALDCVSGISYIDVGECGRVEEDSSMTNEGETMRSCLSVSSRPKGVAIPVPGALIGNSSSSSLLAMGIGPEILPRMALLVSPGCAAFRLWALNGLIMTENDDTGAYQMKSLKNQALILVYMKAELSV